MELASDTISQRQMVPPEQTIVPIRSQPVCTKNDVLLPELDQLSVQANHPRYLQLAPTVNIAVDNNYPKGLPPAPELKACSQDNISVASTNKDATGSSKSRLEPTAAIIAKLTASTVASRARQRKILDELQVSACHNFAAGCCDMLNNLKAFVSCKIRRSIFYTLIA